MTFKEIQELIKQINKSNLTEFKMKDGDFEISIRTKDFVKSKSQIVQPTQQIVPVQAAPVAATMPVQQMPAPQPAKEAEAPKSDTGNGTSEKSDSAESTYIEIKSPIVGTFYRSPSPDKPPYIKVGDTVEVGDVVCIVEAMKLFNEIESEVSGKVVKISTEDASPCEYDQVLFVLDPNG